MDYVDLCNSPLNMLVSCHTFVLLLFMCLLIRVLLLIIDTPLFCNTSVFFYEYQIILYRVY